MDFWLISFLYLPSLFLAAVLYSNLMYAYAEDKFSSVVGCIKPTQFITPSPSLKTSWKCLVKFYFSWKSSHISGEIFLCLRKTLRGGPSATSTSIKKDLLKDFI
ncbi:hypothetical protein AMECASPLE_033728 [Ameca splendens]|uniref:Secreted protein n=1 Tax=Ameca splendens TaxID=208324 RepID=A0ABV1AGL6_9TELE